MKASKWKKKYKAKVIAIQADKGGVGKTTLAINLSTELVEKKKKKVLLIDMDEQCNSGFDLGFSVEQIIELTRRNMTCARLFTDRHVDMKSITLRGIVQELPDLYFISSTFNLMYTERMLQDESHRVMRPVSEDELGDILYENPEVKKILPDYEICTEKEAHYPEATVLRETFNNNAKFLDQFDYIIIDSKPSISHINENELAVCDSLIVVTDPSYNSLMGIETLYNFWEVQRQKIGIDADYETAVVLNRFRPRGTIDRQIEAILKGDMDYKDVPEYAKSLFADYHELYIDCPIPENVRFKQRSGIAIPMVVLPDKDERKIIEEVIDQMIEKLYERKIL